MKEWRGCGDLPRGRAAPPPRPLRTHAPTDARHPRPPPPTHARRRRECNHEFAGASVDAPEVPQGVKKGNFMITTNRIRVGEGRAAYDRAVATIKSWRHLQLGEAARWRAHGVTGPGRGPARSLPSAGRLGNIVGSSPLTQAGTAPPRPP